MRYRLKLQAESSLKALAQIYRQQKELEAQVASGDFFGASNAHCGDALCRWHTNHLWGRLNLSVDPCEDFYSFVCSASWFENETIQDQPYALFSAAQLMADVDDALSRRFAALNVGSTAWSFVYQSAELLRACASAPRTGSSWEDVREILSDIGIAGWPYVNSSKELNLVSLVAKMERSMGFCPFADVTLFNYSVITDYEIHISPPTTLLRRFVLHRNFAGLPISVYEEELRKVLDKFLPNKSRSERLGSDIVAFERHVEAIDTVETVPVNEQFMNINELGKVSKWNWKTFLNSVFEGIKNITDDIVMCVRCSFFKKLTVVIEETPSITLINYVGIRVLVALSPLLPEENEFLMILGQEIPGLSGISQRHHSCVNLLERVYRYGTAMIARMSLSKNLLNVYRTHYDKQVDHLAQALTRAVVRRSKRISWMTQDRERTVAAAKFQTIVMDIFGTTPSVYWPALYYGIASPRINRSDVVKSYVKLLQHTRKSYLGSISPNLDFDAKYAGRVFIPEAAYFHSRSFLFIPQVVVGFLNHVSNEIDSSFIPVVGRPILEAVMRVLDDVGAHVDDKHGLRSWWTASTTSNIDSLKKCLIDQYAAMYWPSADMKRWKSYVDINRLLREVALTGPLYDTFASTTPASMTVKISNGSEFDSQRLFFINYALSLCDHHRRHDVVRLQRKLRVVPGAVVVNLALMNSQEFSRAYKCQVGSPMNPEKRCMFW
ncbi:neprilysin-1-like isoform X2 [Ornithodoros turicata]|uniref:neprilysin-1-like isoform X2 n=1 Tax=Ornithodoros turicata TaxID=34597 RepID=UPI0031395E3B